MPLSRCRYPRERANPGIRIPVGAAPSRARRAEHCRRDDPSGNRTVNFPRPRQCGGGEHRDERADELCGLNFPAQAHERPRLQYVERGESEPFKC